MSPRQKKAKPQGTGFRAPHLLIAAAVVVVVALVLLRRSPVVATPGSANSPIASSGELRKSGSAALPPAQTSSDAFPAISAGGPTPTPAVAPDPSEQEENAKIAYHIDNFRAYSTRLDGFKLENVQMVNDGLVLGGENSDETSETGSFRRGVVESPVITLAHASNAFQPIWRAALPGGETAIQVELATSADGQDWSKWNTIQPSGDDISPTYPDGRPNPNYGAVSGTIVCDGQRLYPFMRYRVTMTSTGADASPALEEFKVTYLDSTEGEGYLGEAGPQPPPDVPPSEQAHPVIGTPVPSSEAPGPVAGAPLPENAGSAPAAPTPVPGERIIE